MIEKGVQRITDFIENKEYKKLGLLFWAAVLLTAWVVLRGSNFRHLRVEQHIFFAVAIGLCIPLKTFKKEKIFLWVQRYPLELPAIAFFIALIFVNGRTWTFQNAFRNGHLNIILEFALAWFLMLLSAGYLTAYLKDIWLSPSGFKKDFNERSYLSQKLSKFYLETFKMDLGKNMKRRLLFSVLAHSVFIAFLFVLLVATIDSGDDFFVWLGVFSFPVYLFLIWIVACRKVGRIQSQYRQLFAFTKEISSGNLDVPMNADLGLFNSLRDELAQVKIGFKTAVQNETASERMKTDLIANVSHDLKTPLTSIVTYTDLLQDPTLSEEKRQQYLTVLEQKSHRLQLLIEDLFEMSRVTSGNIQLDLQPLNVVALIKQTLSELSDQIEGAGLMVRGNYPETPVMLSLDGMRTHRVFENLIVNMCKYALPGTRAYIDIEERGLDVLITLRNISATELNIDPKELTERFVRADGSRSTEGSGLGLAIAKSLVAIQEGAFDVQIDGDLFKVMIAFKK